MTTLSSIRRTIDLATGVGTTTYATAAELPTSGLTAGDQAFITSTGRLYISNSNGWYNIALINQAPYWIEQPDGSYTLSTTGLSTVITILASDSDSTAPSYTATADSDFNQIATITTDSEGADGTRFIVTPIDSENGTAIAGSGTVTFIATDGINQASVVSTFSLSFVPDWTVAPTESKLTASDGAQYDQLGYGVAISGDGAYAIAGAWGEDGGAGDPYINAGAAYVYTKSGSTWTEQTILTASDPGVGDQFGNKLDINSDGTYAIVCAPREAGGAGDPLANAGAAYIFTRSGSTWTQQAKLVSSDLQANDYFGISVSINSDATYAIVGAYLEDGGAGDPLDAAGAAYIFTRSGSTWTQQAKLTASDAQGDDYFGYSVSINGDGDYAIVGANGEDTGGSSAGAAYIFTRSGSTWTQQQKIQSSDIQANDNFGISVSMSSDGDYAVVGAYGENGGPGDPINAAGAAYVFTRSGSTWTEQAILRASDAQSVDRLGQTVSISGDGAYAITGAPYEDGGAGNPISYAGAAYIYEAG